MLVNRFAKFGPGFLDKDIEAFKEERVSTNKYAEMGSLRMVMMD